MKIGVQDVLECHPLAVTHDLIGILEGFLCYLLILYSMVNHLVGNAQTIVEVLHTYLAFYVITQLFLIVRAL